MRVLITLVTAISLGTLTAAVAGERITAAGERITAANNDLQLSRVDNGMAASTDISSQEKKKKKKKKKGTTSRSSWGG